MRNWTIRSRTLAVALLLTSFSFVTTERSAAASCDTGQPGLLGFAPSFDGTAVGVAPAGDIVYVADYTSGGTGRLQSFDVSDPCNPVRQPGFADNPGNEIGDIATDGSHVYVAGDENGLRVYDLPTPTTFSFVAGRSDSSYNHSVVLNNGKAYAGYIYAYNGHGLTIYDLATFPNTAWGVNPNPGSGRADALDVAVSGTMAYIYESAGDGMFALDIVDIADPAAPVRVSRLPFWYEQYGDGGEIRVQGGYAYMSFGDSSAHDGGLVVIDVSNPAAPVEVASRFWDNAGGLPWKGNGLGISGDRAYVVSADGVHVIDISDPVNPVTLTTMAFPSQAAPGAMSGHIEFVGDLAYVTISNPGLGGLAVYRVNPAVVLPPTVPTDFQATWTGADVELSWIDTSGNETGFQIQRLRYIASTNAWTVVAGWLLPQDTSTSVDSSVPDGQYAYTLRSYNDAGGSVWAIATLTVSRAVAAPDAPSALTLQSAGTDIRLDWVDEADNELGFEVMRARWAAGVWTEWSLRLGDIDQQTLTESAVSDGFYAYLVRAYNGFGASPWTIQTIMHSTALVPPPAPTDLVATTSGADVVLNWTDNAVDEYVYEIGRARFDPTTQTWGEWTFFLADRNAVTYTDTNVPAGQYAYLVRATNSTGSSDWAAVVTNV